MIRKTTMIAVLLGLAVGPSWASSCHTGGHSGHSSHDSGSNARSGSHRHDDNYDWIQKVEKKKMKIEARLRDPNLTPAKRAKLERRLEALQSQH